MQLLNIIFWTFSICNFCIAAKHSIPFLLTDAKEPDFDLSEYQRSLRSLNTESDNPVGLKNTFSTFSFVVQPDIKQFLDGDLNLNTKNLKLEDLVSDDIPLEDRSNPDAKNEEIKSDIDKQDYVSHIYDSQLEGAASDDISLQSSKREAEAGPYRIKKAELSSAKTNFYSNNNFQPSETFPFYPRPYLPNLPGQYSRGTQRAQNSKAIKNNFQNSNEGNIPISQKSNNQHQLTFQNYSPATELGALEQVFPASHKQTHSGAQGYIAPKIPSFIPTPKPYISVVKPPSPSYSAPPASSPYQPLEPGDKLIDILRINDEVQSISLPITGKSLDSEFEQSNSIIPKSKFLNSGEDSSESVKTQDNIDDSQEEKNNLELGSPSIEENDGTQEFQEVAGPAILSQGLPGTSRENVGFIYEGDLGEFGDTGRQNLTLEVIIPSSEETSSEEKENTTELETTEIPLLDNIQAQQLLLQPIVEDILIDNLEVDSAVPNVDNEQTIAQEFPTSESVASDAGSNSNRETEQANIQKTSQIIIPQKSETETDGLQWENLEEIDNIDGAIQNKINNEQIADDNDGKTVENLQATDKSLPESNSFASIPNKVPTSNNEEVLLNQEIHSTILQENQLNPNDATINTNVKPENIPEKGFEPTNFSISNDGVITFHDGEISDQLKDIFDPTISKSEVEISANNDVDTIEADFQADASRTIENESNLDILDANTDFAKSESVILKPTINIDESDKNSLIKSVDFNDEKIQLFATPDELHQEEENPTENQWHASFIGNEELVVNEQLEDVSNIPNVNESDKKITSSVQEEDETTIFRNWALIGKINDEMMKSEKAMGLLIESVQNYPYQKLPCNGDACNPEKKSEKIVVSSSS